MSGRPILCGACGASSSAGDDFYFVQLSTAAAVELIVGIEEDGAPVLVGLADVSHSPLIGRDEIRCGSCDHQWRTSRRNPADAER